MTRFLKYTLVYLATMVFLMALNWALLSFMNYDLPSGLATILPAIMAAMSCGQDYARQHQVTYPKSLAWSHAVQYTGVSVLIALVVFGVMMVVEPDILMLFKDVPAILWAGVGVFLLLLTTLINRYFLGAGAKAVLKTLG